MFVEFGVLVIQSVDIQLLPGPPPASSGPSIGQRVGGFLSSLMGGAWNRCKSTVEVTLWMLLIFCWLCQVEYLRPFAWVQFESLDDFVSAEGVAGPQSWSARPWASIKSNLKWFEGWISYDRQGLPFCFFGKIWKDPYRDPLNHLMLGLRGNGSEQVISTFAFVEQEKRKVVAEVRQRPVGRAGSQC